MKRFQWPLERVHRVREIQEEVARAAWAEAAQRARAAEEHVDALRAARDEARAKLMAVPGERFDPAQAALDRDLVDRASRAISHARERAKTLAFQAERLRRPWEERRRDVRGLEKLREKASTHHRRDARRSEADELDEIAQQRAAARRPHDSESS